MAAPALRHDALRTDATIEDVRRGTATRQRPHRSPSRDSGGRPARHVSVGAPLTAPRAAPRSTPRTAPRTAPRQDEELEDLNETEHHVAARRRVRRGHKSRSLPRVPIMAGTLILGQVLLLLYVSSLGMAATHSADTLDKRIAETTEEIKQSQKRISAATSKTQMEVWAKKLDLRLVQQSDIDRVDESARPSGFDSEGDVP